MRSSDDATVVMASSLRIFAMILFVEPSVDHTSFARPAVDGLARHACTLTRYEQLLRRMLDSDSLAQFVSRVPQHVAGLGQLGQSPEGFDVPNHVVHLPFTAMVTYHVRGANTCPPSLCPCSIRSQKYSRRSTFSHSLHR